MRECHLAHNSVSSIKKGMPVIVVGRLRSRQVEKECGDHKHTMYFEIGRDWRELNVHPLPQSILLGWAAEAARISAQALQSQGGRLVLAREWIERWDGKLPTVSGGNGAMIIDIRELMQGLGKDTLQR